MALCPCCSGTLLRHIRGHQITHFCRHCWQDMPLIEPMSEPTETLHPLSIPGLKTSGVAGVYRHRYGIRSVSSVEVYDLEPASTLNKLNPERVRFSQSSFSEAARMIGLGRLSSQNWN
jgi:hypothetical protein